MAETDLAWAAGFIDADGSINISVKHTTSRYGVKYQNYFLNLYAAQVVEEPLTKLKNLFGGSINIRPAVGKKRAAFIWNVASVSAVIALEKMQPYFVRKNKQVQIALEFASTITRKSGRGRTPSTVVQKRKELRDSLMELHHNG